MPWMIASLTSSWGAMLVPLQLLGNMIRYLLAMVIGHIALSKLSRFAWYKTTRCIYASMLSCISCHMHILPLTTLQTMSKALIDHMDLQDDKEADEIWEKVDEFMDDRRRDRREKRLQEQLEQYRADNPKITEQFADLKRKLADIAEDDWNSIPDIGDYTIKKRPRTSFAPVPDTLLQKAAAEKETVTALDAQAGLSTPASGMTTNLTSVGEGRRTVIGLSLDKMADSVSGQTVVDPKGYMTDLGSIQVKSDAEIGDIKKARMLLKSVINTNPRHAPGWVAAARLEEVAGKLADARQLLQKGCEMCPQSEDIWLEAARLQTPDNAKAVLARGVAANPNSVKLWMQASRLEADVMAQSRVLRRALERIPTAVRLWKSAVELANEDDARVLLSRAVECCPQVGPPSCLARTPLCMSTQSAVCVAFRHAVFFGKRSASVTVWCYISACPVHNMHHCLP